MLTAKSARFAGGLLLLVASLPLPGAQHGIRAGAGRVDITPDGPIWMTGYASRTHPSTGVLQHLWAKALAIEDSKGGRVVIVTTDLVGLPRAVTDAAAARIQKAHGLDRARLLFNSSHTHTGPLVRGNLMTMFDLNAEERAKVDQYGSRLTNQLVEVVAAAIADLSPATLDYAFGEAGFAMNRRQFTANGVKIGVNPQGPTDHSVPVIRVRAMDGKLRAVLFGYACHNTTLTGEFYEISGDYAGFAQAAFEEAHPGATALFLMLCGGDQNPEPRSTLALAGQHGATLAREVDRVLDGKLTPMKGPVRAAYEVTELAFAQHNREQFEKELASSNPSAARRAKAMLKSYDERLPVRRTPYPVQAIRFGRHLTLLALGGEVVVDYDLRAKREFGGTNLVVAGYSNDVMCYIPSQRVLNEGGYEAVDSMIYYGQPGPFDADVEERVFSAIHRVMKRVRH
jgi:neutral ceramidase